VAVRLALSAGCNMMHHLESKGTHAGKDADSALGISTKKNDTDFCTAIDIQNENLICKGIEQSFPDHIIIGEEATGTDKPDQLTEIPTWIINPIDGTTNFASGCPLTCVSIGFCMNATPVMGVVYAPATEELYLAMSGVGAWRNGVRISLDESSCQKTLSNSVVVFEFGYARSTIAIDKMIGAVREVMKHGCRATRSYGSGVLDLCYVASGRVDVVYTGIDEEGWKPWDYCAAMVVVEETGCIIQSLKETTTCDQGDNLGTPLSHSKFNIYSSSMVCGVNASVVNECKNVVLGQ